MAVKIKTASVYEIKTALICDGVRKEISGQDIIIGVYSDEIAVPQLPSLLALTLYLRVKFKRSEQSNIGFRVRGESGNQIIPDVQFQIMPQDIGRITTVVMGPLPINIQSFGRIIFDLKFSGSEWEPATDLNVVKAGDEGNVIRQPDHPTVLQPLS